MRTHRWLAAASALTFTLAACEVATTNIADGNAAATEAGEADGLAKLARSR